jgi:hypothetical protein
MVEVPVRRLPGLASRRRAPSILLFAPNDMAAGVTSIQWIMPLTPVKFQNGFFHRRLIVLVIHCAVQRDPSLTYSEFDTLNRVRERS